MHNPRHPSTSVKMSTNLCPREPRARIIFNNVARRHFKNTVLTRTPSLKLRLRLANPARRVLEPGCRTQGEDA